MNKEIEKKYLVKYIPNDLKFEKIVKIAQSFIYRDFKTMIRIRKIQDKKTDDLKYVYTLKTKSGLDSKEQNNNISNLYEIESNINEEKYTQLLKNKISKTIIKNRMVAPIDKNLKVEIDVYEDYLKGLLTAEVEFKNEEEAENFIKPEWLGEELSYKELSNWHLSKMETNEWQTKLSKEIIENNKKIIRNLNMNYDL